MARKSKKLRLKIVHPHCAGVDVGSREHWVAVEPGSCEQPVRCFTTFTDDLHKLADWLKSLGVQVVAMEATGVYWIPLFEVLDARGLDVQLVNSRATRQVSGRKSDVLDCQWIWQLMSHGLLRGAYRPADAVCSLRSFVRQRATKVAEQSRCIAHMQKALTQMNVQLDNVVSDLMGKTGTAILRRIVAGERDPQQLAKLRNRRLRADEATVARSLHGNWREEHLLALAQALGHYDFLGEQIDACDQMIEQALNGLPSLSEETTQLAKIPRSKRCIRSWAWTCAPFRRWVWTPSWYLPVRSGRICRVFQPNAISAPGSPWRHLPIFPGANRYRGENPPFSIVQAMPCAKPPPTPATATATLVPAIALGWRGWTMSKLSRRPLINWRA